jgi:hypothetical protein
MFEPTRILDAWEIRGICSPSVRDIDRPTSNTGAIFLYLGGILVFVSVARLNDLSSAEHNLVPIERGSIRVL